MDSMPPATTISLSPSMTPCAASADGFQARAADLIDGHGGDARIEAAVERRLPRGILAEAGLHHVAHDDFVDGLRLDAGAAHGFGHDFGAEFRGGERRESALNLPTGVRTALRMTGCSIGNAPSRLLTDIDCRKFKYRRGERCGQFCGDAGCEALHEFGESLVGLQIPASCVRSLGPKERFAKCRFCRDYKMRFSFVLCELRDFLFGLVYRLEIGDFWAIWGVLAALCSWWGEVICSFP